MIMKTPMTDRPIRMDHFDPSAYTGNDLTYLAPGLDIPGDPWRTAWSAYFLLRDLTEPDANIPEPFRPTAGVT